MKKLNKQAKAMVKQVGEQIHDQFLPEQNEVAEVETTKKGVNMKKAAIVVAGVAAIGAIGFGVYKLVTRTGVEDVILDTDAMADAATEAVSDAVAGAVEAVTDAI